MPLFTAIGHFVDAINLFCLQQLVDLVNLQAAWPWLLIGFLPPLVFLPATRLAMVCPKERSWALLPLRWLGKGLLLAVACAVGAALIITQFAHDHALEIYRRQLAQADAEAMVAKLWAYVGGQLHLVGWGALAGLVLGIVALIGIVHYLEPALVQKLRQWGRRANPDTLTDVRTIEDHLPKPREFDARKFFPKARELNVVFLGVNERGEPVWMPRKDWKVANVQVMGAQGAGKGVLAAVALAQSIGSYDDGVYIWDPKFQGDEWGPSVFVHICAAAKRPMVKVNLASSEPRINPLAGITAANLGPLLINACGVAHTTGIDDVYRSEDRKAATKLAALADEGPVCLASLADRARDVLDESEIKAARKFLNALEELARLKSVATLEGVDIRQPIDRGGALYFTGSTTDPAVIMLQRLVFLRVMQLVEQRPLGGRHITLFCDEFKHHLSPQALIALATLRDRGGNVILTHQTLGDFNELPQLDADQVRTVVTGTTTVKWFYRAMDEESAKWIAGHTGKILVERDRTTATQNETGAETVHGQRTVEKVERYLIDVNMVQNLPKGCAVCIGVGKAKLAFASPLIGPKYTFKPKVFTRYERRMGAGDWLKMPPLVTAKDDDDKGGNSGGDAGGALL